MGCVQTKTQNNFYKIERNKDKEETASEIGNLQNNKFASIYEVNKERNSRALRKVNEYYKDKLRLNKWVAMIKEGLRYISNQEEITIYLKVRGEIENNFLDSFNLTESKAEIGLFYYRISKANLFLRRVRKGPPQKFRWLAWKVLLGFPNIFKQGIYEVYKKEKCDSAYEDAINKDAVRTYSSNICRGLISNSIVPKLITSLMNVLKSYSVYNKKVGYCQGMNFIAGMLLLMSQNREEEAFWVFASLMENSIPQDPLQFMGIQGFYQNYFPQLQVLNEVFKLLIFKKFPSIYAHFIKLEYFELFFLIKWALSLFLYDFPLDFCIRIWDYIFSFGISFLTSFSAILICTKEKEILESDSAQAYKIISDIKSEINYDNLLILLKKSKNLKVDWKSLEKERICIEHTIKNKITVEESKFISDQILNNSFSKSSHYKNNNYNIAKSKLSAIPKTNKNKADNIVRKALFNEFENFVGFTCKNVPQKNMRLFR